MRILLVGCGSIGERHLRNLIQLGAGEVAVCDTDAARRAAAANYGVKTFETLEAALDWDPALGLVCTPTAQHLSQALALARAGCHLFIEKPLAHQLDGIPELAAEVESRRLVALVGSNMRFHPAVARLRAAVRAGEVGDLLWLRAHYGHYLPNWRPAQPYQTSYSARATAGGGVILDAIHEIDYVRWLVGDVTEVFCVAGKVSTLAVDVEDVADVVLTCANGCRATVHLDYLDQVKRRSCEIIGSTGTLIWRSVGRNPEQCVLEHHVSNQSRSIEQFAVDINAPYVQELRHLLDCVNSGAVPSLGLREAWADLAIALAAREAALQRRPVRLEPIGSRSTFHVQA